MGYRVLSLFSGAGGLDLGFHGGFEFLGTRYEEHKFEIVAAYDNDEKAVDTYNRNIKPVCELKDVTTLRREELPNNIHVVIGGFPCQDFSVAGKRQGITVHRGKLYQALVKIVEWTNPVVFVAENVKGLLSANKGLAIRVITEDFSKAGVGYKIHMSVLNAANFGVPQIRERVFIVGVRNDIPTSFSFPSPTHDRPERAKWLGLKPWITAKEALADLEEPEELLKLPNHEYSKAKKNKGQGNAPISPDKPAPTIRAEHHGNIEFHYSLPRRLSVREAARLQSFPDWFVFCGSMSHSYKLVGNAVPPVLAWHLARSVELLLDQALGDLKGGILFENCGKTCEGLRNSAGVVSR